MESIMYKKRTFIIKGIDCPNCANKIEKAVANIEGVQSASVNFLQEILIVEFNQNIDDSINESVSTIVHKLEPDIEISVKKKPKAHHNEHSHENNNFCFSCECEHEHHEHKSEHTSADHTAEFSLDGLDCPHCAGEIESDLEKIQGVAYAEINLITQTLTVGLDKDFKGDLTNYVKKSVKKFEPEVKVNGESVNQSNSILNLIKSDKATLIRLIVGAIIYGVGVLLSVVGNIPQLLFISFIVVSYVILGYDVVIGAVRNIFSGRLFDEQFLMTISTVGAFVIGEYPEAAAVMLLYQIGEFFQNSAVKRSRKSISDLMNIRPDSANLVVDDDVKTVSPEVVKIGDVILVKPGEKISLDGEIIEGETMIDTKAITGESVPKTARIGDSVFSGCVNQTGAIKIKVTKEFGESTVSKILELVENAVGRKAPSENFISKFAKYYTPIIVACALIVAVVPPLILGGNWTEWIRRCFVFLVISCPCALVISIPLTFFGGIGEASRKGILIKGSNYLEALNDIDTIVFDKTGTLTKGVFDVSEISAVGMSKSDLLKITASAEGMSNHPIAKSIISAYHGILATVTDYTELSGYGISAKVDGASVIVGNYKLMQDNEIVCDKNTSAGTIVYVAVDRKFAGTIVISDEIKKDSRQAVAELKKIGIKRIVMLTGDNDKTAQNVAQELNIDECYTELLPNEKVEKLEDILSSGKTAFVGDGINDAPVLARADIGIAMGALGADSAIEASDIVLMNDTPSSIAEAVRIARKTKRVVTQNIVFVLAVKVILLILGAFGIAGMWEAIFGDVGVMMIATAYASISFLRKS